MLLFAGMLLCGLNLLSGGPLLALWVGSKAQGSSSGSSMAAIAVVVVVLLAIELCLARLLGALTGRYDEATGYRHKRHQTAWLKPMSAEREGGLGGAARRISPSERLLAALVVLAVVAFEVWFFFFAGSSLPAG